MMVDATMTNFASMSKTSWKSTSSESTFFGSSVSFERSEAVHPWKSLERPDIRNWRIAIVALSTISSLGLVVLGTLMFLRFQPLPEFLHDKCSSENNSGISWAGLREFKWHHFAFPSTKVASMAILLLVNIIITAFLDTHSSIHASARLWYSEKDSGGRCKYNTNSRFFGGTKDFGTYPYLGG